MNLGELWTWIGETDDILTRLLEHMRLAYIPVLVALLFALPAGLAIGHSRRFEFLVVTLANLGRAIPSFAILAIFLPISLRLNLGLGFWPTFAALFFLSLPPILTNTYVAVKGVDPDTVEAARGMGMSGKQILARIEVPLSAPLIVAGVRTAAVECVATATLAALVAGGGLGNYIRLGFRAGDDEALLGGAILVALLAIVTEVALGFVERALRPKTGSPARRHRGPATRPPLVQPASD